jgi:ABC-type oligopeptide transport system ATPase subunit
LLIVGEAGSGKTTIAEQIAAQFPLAGRLNYSGSLKIAIGSLAESLGLEPGKTAESMKDQVVKFSQENELMIIGDNATRYPASVRYWLQGLVEEGAVICLFAAERKPIDIFLSLTYLDIPQPSDRQIRELMEQEADLLGISIPSAKISALQQRAGTNLMLAKKVIQEFKLGTLKEVAEHEEYIDILPLILALVSVLTILRFVGMGTGDRTLYLIGGVSLAVFYGLRLSLQFLNQKPRRQGK